MNTKFSWDFNYLKNETLEWVNNPQNKKLFYDRSIEKINGFLSGDNLNPGIMANNLNNLSIWYLNSSIIKVIENERDGFDELYLSTIYNYWYLRIMAKFFNHETKRPKLIFNDVGLTLSRLIALGLFDEAEIIGGIVVKELDSDWLMGQDDTRLTPFILNLLYKWQNKSLPLDQCEKFCFLESYQSLLDNWQTEDLSLLEDLLIDVCEFHLSRSKYDTDDEYYEFSNEIFMIYPVEILSVLRLRDSLKLKNPNINHRLINNPLGRLNEIQKVESNELIKDILSSKVIKDLGVQ